ncbi:uncharacterized protein UTRI_01485_B [Ustilago trichophora]|uniref:SUZ domain-containing protein n=1 Tax=Ustilago trichophora TaxID=86804 RepID=A0A5C3E2L9_9BASI|nr:uncharacterized protein UTRI_01485_B [Ustilago trichophora]
MSNSIIGEQAVVSTSKFKPSKPSAASRQRQQESEVVDDWDAESSSDDDNSDIANTKNPNAGRADVFRASKHQWTEANSQAPAPVPIVASVHGRSLPADAFGHRLNVTSAQRNSDSQPSVLKPHGGVTIAAAPPRILQRPKEAAPGMRSDGTLANSSNSASQERKTVEQRQEEYRLARERIFGPSTKSTSNKGGASKR